MILTADCSREGTFLIMEVRALDSITQCEYYEDPLDVVKDMVETLTDIKDIKASWLIPEQKILIETKQYKQMAQWIIDMQDQKEIVDAQCQKLEESEKP
jgi:hypothetical protein